MKCDYCDKPATWVLVLSQTHLCDLHHADFHRDCERVQDEVVRKAAPLILQGDPMKDPNIRRLLDD